MRIITDKYMYAWWMIATVQCDHEYQSNVLKSLFTAKYLTELSQATHPDDCCFHTLCISLMPRVDGLSSPCTIALQRPFSHPTGTMKTLLSAWNASLYHLILHYTFREQNTSQSRASSASPNQNLLHLWDFISIHPSTPCESEAARSALYWDRGTRFSWN